jgi:ABC-2 type transport system permease protein
MFTVTLRALVILVLGSLLFGVTYTAAGSLPAIGVFLLTLSALYCLGMLLASLFLFYGREAEHLANAMQEPVNFLSGLYFPVQSLGAYVGGAASLVPMTLGLDAMRQLLLPGTPVFIPAGTEALLVAIQVPIYAVLAGISLRYMEKRARRDGKLVTRWE